MGATKTRSNLFSDCVATNFPMYMYNRIWISDMYTVNNITTNQ